MKEFQELARDNAYNPKNVVACLIGWTPWAGVSRGWPVLHARLAVVPPLCEDGFALLWCGGVRRVMAATHVILVQHPPVFLGAPRGGPRRDGGGRVPLPLPLPRGRGGSSP
jgi:hypothetical protein